MRERERERDIRGRGKGDGGEGGRVATLRSYLYKEGVI